MSEVARIQEELRRALGGEAWHGRHLRVLLEGVTAEQAVAHPVEGAHSIAELVLHIAAWSRAGRKAAEGTPILVSDEEDFPSVAGPADWDRARLTLEREHAALLTALEHRSDEDLERTVPGREYNYYHLLHGVVQHCAYHGGQIALLRRAAGCDS